MQHRAGRLGLVVAVVLCLAACAGHGLAPATGTGPAAHSQTGVASWYGPEFHRKRTASGERFDMNALTAAHRSLPLDTLVRVTNLENGRAVVVRINDRGPYHRGRIIDLSAKAARLLDMREDGVARVRLDVVRPANAAVGDSHDRAYFENGPGGA